ncbi:MAG TPA: hypothetical protein VF307_08535 [Candidatus Nanopelagicaceae bacterium]
MMRSVTPKPEVVANIRDTVINATDPIEEEIVIPPVDEVVDVTPDDHNDVPNWGFQEPKKRRRNFKRLIPYVITAVIFSGLTLGAEYFLHSKQISIDNATLILHGGQTIDEKELRSLVVARGLNVYWLGSKPGMKYLINTSQANGISLRCIYPAASSGTAEPYYDVGTFVSQNAFALTQKAAQQANGVGFVNIDGNAVYYDSRDPKNVYIGLKNADIQVEIYDPRPDQALAAALLQGNLKKII